MLWLEDSKSDRRTSRMKHHFVGRSMISVGLGT